MFSSECSLSSLAFLSTKYGGQGLAQFLKNRVPIAIGMSFLETSVTSRSDIMDRHYLSGQYLKPIKVNTAGLNLSLPTIEIKAIIRTSHRRAPELGEERRYEIW